ncbi:MAG: hypothetical protein AAGE01_08845 [Pseudomonadota bacterium]
MRKSLLYRWFGLGKVPRAQREVLEAESIVLLDEGLRGLLTLRRFRGPGRFHSLKKSTFAGSIAVTRTRFVAFAFSRPVVNLPLASEHIDRLQLSIPSEGQLLIEFDAGDFDERCSGEVQCRFHTAIARKIRRVVRAAGEA